ncbi:hypothetical protein V8E54_012125 [Elaphomyces granulatus]|jgi:hypothetical protein
MGFVDFDHVDPIAESIEGDPGPQPWKANATSLRQPTAPWIELHRLGSWMKSSLPLLSLWFCKPGNRLGADQRMSRYFHQTLKEKRDRRLQAKHKDRRAVLDSCTATARTQGRARDVSGNTALTPTAILKLTTVLWKPTMQ